MAPVVYSSIISSQFLIGNVHYRVCYITFISCLSSFSQNFSTDFSPVNFVFPSFSARLFPFSFLFFNFLISFYFYPRKISIVFVFGSLSVSRYGFAPAGIMEIAQVSSMGFFFFFWRGGDHACLRTLSGGGRGRFVLSVSPSHVRLSCHETIAVAPKPPEDYLLSSLLFKSKKPDLGEHTQARPSSAGRRPRMLIRCRQNEKGEKVAPGSRPAINFGRADSKFHSSKGRPYLH